jgi:hypothetical protein
VIKEATMRLMVKQVYQARELSYTPGHVIDVADDLGALLMRDAPEAFVRFVEPTPAPVVAAPVAAAIGTPPVDKMLRVAPVRKQKRK